MCSTTKKKPDKKKHLNFSLDDLAKKNVVADKATLEPYKKVMFPGYDPDAGGPAPPSVFLPHETPQKSNYRDSGNSSGSGKHRAPDSGGGKKSIFLPRDSKMLQQDQKGSHSSKSHSSRGEHASKSSRSGYEQKKRSDHRDKKSSSNYKASDETYMERYDRTYKRPETSDVYSSRNEYSRDEPIVIDDQSEHDGDRRRSRRHHQSPPSHPPPPTNDYGTSNDSHYLSNKSSSDYYQSRSQKFPPPMNANGDYQAADGYYDRRANLVSRDREPSMDRDRVNYLSSRVESLTDRVGSFESKMDRLMGKMDQIMTHLSGGGGSSREPHHPRETHDKYERSDRY